MPLKRTWKEGYPASNLFILAASMLLLQLKTTQRIKYTEYIKATTIIINDKVNDKVMLFPLLLNNNDEEPYP
jgi:hypothetical protein